MVLLKPLTDHHPATSLFYIPEKEMERFERLRRPNDVQSIADMYFIPKHLIRNAFDRHRTSEEVLNALREFYGTGHTHD